MEENKNNILKVGEISSVIFGSLKDNTLVSKNNDFFISTGDQIKISLGWQRQLLSRIDSKLSAKEFVVKKNNKKENELYFVFFKKDLVEQSNSNLMADVLLLPSDKILDAFSGKKRIKDAEPLVKKLRDHIIDNKDMDWEQQIKDLYTGKNNENNNIDNIEEKENNNFEENKSKYEDSKEEEENNDLNNGNQSFNNNTNNNNNIPNNIITNESIDVNNSIDNNSINRENNNILNENKEIKNENSDNINEIIDFNSNIINQENNENNINNVKEEKEIKNNNNFEDNKSKDEDSKEEEENNEHNNENNNIEETENNDPNNNIPNNNITNQEIKKDNNIPNNTTTNKSIDFRININQSQENSLNDDLKNKTAQQLPYYKVVWNKVFGGCCPCGLDSTKQERELKND